MFRNRRFPQIAVYGKAASGGPTLNFIGQTTFSPGAGGTQTITGVSIGTANANRRVIIVVAEARSSTSLITDLTIGGTSVGATLQVTNNNASYNGQIAVGYVDIAAGATATVTIVGGATSGDENLDAFYIYTVDKSTLSGSPVYNANAIGSTVPTTSNTVTANTTSGGFIIAVLVLPGFSGASAMSITSSTETYANDGSTLGGQAISYISSKKSGAAANTPTSVTFGWTTSAGSVAAIYTWR